MKNALLLFVFIPFWSMAQESIPTRSTMGAVLINNTRSDTNVNAVNFLEKSVWRVEFFGPGIINESRLGRQTSLVSYLRATGAFVFHSTPNGTASENYSAYTINPQLSVAIRQFYNFNRRLERGKSIRYNSGNYVTAKLMYIFPAFIKHNLNRADVRDIAGATGQVMWGFQRTYRKNFYLNAEAGLGFGNFYPTSVAPATYFTLGYTFPNRH